LLSSTACSQSRYTVCRWVAIIHISIWNVSFSILIGQNSVAEWLSG
jgi:hypothetical protein